MEFNSQQFQKIIKSPPNKWKYSPVNIQSHQVLLFEYRISGQHPIGKLCTNLVYSNMECCWPWTPEPGNRTLQNYITLRHFIRQLHLQWPMVRQQSHSSSPDASLKRWIFKSFLKVSVFVSNVCFEQSKFWLYDGFNYFFLFFSHPPHHHTLCSLQAMQILSLHCPCLSPICQHTLDTGPKNLSVHVIWCTTGRKKVKVKYIIWYPASRELQEQAAINAPHGHSWALEKHPRGAPGKPGSALSSTIFLQAWHSRASAYARLKIFKSFSTTTNQIFLSFPFCYQHGVENDANLVISK